MFRNNTDTADELQSVQHGEPLIEIENLSKHFDSDSGFLASIVGTEKVKAVDDVSFELRKGETLALVGESGCGKSTLARTLLQLERPTSGSVRFKGKDLAELSDRNIRPLRQNLQMVFQDPQSSLNPRMKVGKIIEEPMKAHGLYESQERTERAKSLLEEVGLERSHYFRYPHEFSGGQRQRVNLARAFSTNPDVIMCDEPVAALDVSVQAQVLKTMRRLQEKFDVTYLFISHDMSVVRYIADRVAVMYLGHIVELGEKEVVFENPQHPYTEALLKSVPVPDPRAEGSRGQLEGDVPSPVNPPSGCRFRTRCPKLIQPGKYGADETDDTTVSSFAIEEEDWRNVITFSREVQRRGFTTEEDESQESIRETIETTHFDGDIPEGEVGGVINDVIAHIADGEWDEAAEVLVTTFEEPSICTRERPQYYLDDVNEQSRHYVACHLHREE